MLETDSHVLTEITVGNSSPQKAPRRLRVATETRPIRNTVLLCYALYRSQLDDLGS